MRDLRPDWLDLRPVFHFVVDQDDAEMQQFLRAAKHRCADPAMLAKISSTGSLCWCLQSYLILSARTALSLSCSNRIDPSAINIVHSPHLLNLRGDEGNFIVSVVADFPRRRWAHYDLVQNRELVSGNSAYIPLWLQPGLIKRDASRRGVTRVAYVGQTFNGNFASDPAIWRNHLEPHGIEFVVPETECWYDLSSIDVLIGIRSFDENPYYSKPPSKLVNAWHAEIPFIGGNDSAFRQVGMPGEDYLLATTLDDAVAAVLRLRAQEELYSRLVQNGIRKAKDFSEERICAIWEQVLTCEVLTRYKKWLSRRLYERARFRTMLMLGLMEHASKQVYKRGSAWYAGRGGGHLPKVS